ncbi:MAG: hypothetical protein ACP5OB_01535 [Candidatus Ratteibacteria bacterium]
MRNNKNKRNNLKTLFFISMIGCYLIAYVFLYLKIVHIGYIIGKMKDEYETLNLLNKNYNLQLIKLMTPENLEKLAKEKNINLKIPENWCFYKIKEDEKNIKETQILEAGER